jgi:hypothetical protein
MHLHGQALDAAPLVQLHCKADCASAGRRS